MSDITYQFIVVGCGGTGTFFLKEFARYLSYKYYGKTPPKVVVIDGDIVEEKNLERQSFSRDLDIGRPKAACFCEALNECFGIESFTAYPQYIDTLEDLINIKTSSFNSYAYNPIPVLIGCVDNHRARQVMHRYFNKADSVIYIDSANEFSQGEIVTGIRLKNNLIAPDRSYYFPNVMKSREKRASEHSCGTASHRKSQPQSICANMLAGQQLLAIVTNLIDKGEINGGITYFDALKSEMTFVEYENTLGERAVV